MTQDLPANDTEDKRSSFWGTLAIPFMLVAFCFLVLNSAGRASDAEDWARALGAAVGGALFPLFCVWILTLIFRKPWPGWRLILVFSTIGFLGLAGSAGLKIRAFEARKAEVDAHIARWGALEAPFEIKWPEGWTLSEQQANKLDGFVRRTASLQEKGLFVGAVTATCLRPALRNNKSLSDVLDEVVVARRRTAEANNEKLEISQLRRETLGDRMTEVVDIKSYNESPSDERISVLRTANCYLVTRAEAVRGAKERVFAVAEAALASAK